MKKGMDNISVYNDSAIILCKKTPSSIISWITILIIIFIITMIGFFIPFNIYKPYYGVLSIIEDKVYFTTELEYSDFPFDKNDKLYIKNKSYNYKIVNIENNKLILELDLNNEINISNNTVIINILKERTTIMKIVLRKIKKGFGYDRIK